MNESHDSTRSVFDNIRSLDAGLSSHEAWIALLHQSLVCGGSHPNPADLEPDAHCRCRFGQWYYHEAFPSLGTGKTFLNLGNIHQRMHEAARALLLTRRDGDVSPVQYSDFTNEVIAFKLEVRQLQFELMSQVCVVDHLTGTWNRHAMQHRLAQEYERMRRSEQPAAVCLMDLDHFKQVNDRYGHPVGDLVLSIASKHTKQSLRSYDSVFRYGGEEFLICMPDIDTDGAAAIVERLRASLAEREIELASGERLRVTASFGIAAMHPEKSLDDTIQEADHALLCAKAGGRNRICCWQE